MNDADHNEEALEPPVIQGPGKQLREIRIAKDMDINRVASLLHLNVSMLEALEADDFSKLPSAVFVQGYLRNYARLLDIPVASILEAFHQYRPADEEAMNLKAAQIKHEVRSSHTIIRLTTWLIVIAIIALVVTWWRGYLQWPLNLGLEAGNPAAEQQAETPPAASDNLPVDDDGKMTLPALIDKPEILDAPVVEPAGSGVDESPSPVDMTPQEGAAGPLVSGAEAPRSVEGAVAGSMDSALPNSATEVAPATGVIMAEPAQVQASGAIQVRFSDACWTDIKDATGSYRVIGNKAGGDSLVLAGKAPYKMVFGNASAVTILVDGAAFDLTPHIRGNVAKFTLQPE
ncbi:MULTISPECIES: RodZ domain-containing protein [Sedimenticola]|uniref:RodZ domain-containing protein n=1 Tax=Sedimenticola TaxID=349742 RepID=UPI00048A73AC|nr:MULTISPECIES: RodZ family helix-turn-helix domain-containing protein [Sedimenticola]MCW8904873.1 helix-turn-helix domain-containing protein [Sedimenticola sp.]